jgi:N-carbamoylputrescine amidase
VSDETIVRLGLIQMACSPDVETNVERAETLIRDAAGRGAQIVCTQELFYAPYFCQTIDQENWQLAVKIDAKEPLIARLGRLARSEGIVLVASLFEKRAPGLYHNTAAVFDTDGALLGIYRKMHIPDDPHYLEKYYFAPGDLGYRVFATRFGRIGVLICWDQWFPEAARITALKGAEIIFYPTAIGYMPGEREGDGARAADAWLTVQRGHAIANACYVAAVNRVGFERRPGAGGGIAFWGQSFVADPDGAIIAQAREEGDEVLVTAVDRRRIDSTRDRLSHFFRDRRVDSYGEITRRFVDG